MLVNAANGPGIVYRRTINGVCGDANYMFTSLITSYMDDQYCHKNAVAPSFTFIAQNQNGDTLAIRSTYALPLRTATDIKFTEDTYGMCNIRATPQTTSIILTITSDSPQSECDVMFAIHNVIFAATAPIFISANRGGQDINLCEDYTGDIILSASVEPFKYPAMVWQQSFDTGRTWQDVAGVPGTEYTLPHLASGTYLYRIQASEAKNFGSPLCKINSHRTTVTIHSFPPQRPPVVVNGCVNRAVTLNPADASETYLWKGPGGFTSTSYEVAFRPLQYKDTGIYSVKLKNAWCYYTDSFTVNAYLEPGLTVSSSYNVCEGETVQLNASGNGAFAWKPAIGLTATNIPNPVFNGPDSVKYKVYAANTGCADSAAVAVNVLKKVTVDAGPDKVFIKGDTIELTASVKGTVASLTWSPPIYINDIYAVTPLVNPPGTQLYTLTATSPNGCGNSTDDVRVIMFNDIYIPNAFSPNGDGNNDVFRVQPFTDYLVIHMSIYNRWGKIIYNSNEVSPAWDGKFNGKLLSTGAYIYYIEITGPHGKRITRQGTVTLIR